MQYPLSFCTIEGHWLFDDNMMPRTQRHFSLCSMQSIGSADANNIDFSVRCKHFGDVAVKSEVFLNPELFFRSDITTSDELTPWLSADHFRMTLANVTQSNHCEFQSRCHLYS